MPSCVLLRHGSPNTMKNQNKARLRMHNELDGVLHMCVVQSTGLRPETKYDFVELAAWKKEHPGQEPPRITDMGIEKPNNEVVRTEDVMVSVAAEATRSFGTLTLASSPPRSSLMASVRSPKISNM